MNFNVPISRPNTAVKRCIEIHNLPSRARARARARARKLSKNSINSLIKIVSFCVLCRGGKILLI